MPTNVEITVRGTNRFGVMFRALSHYNFRLFWLGAFVSNVGTWMQAVAQGWLVLQLTGSPFWLGVDSFMATAPGLVLTLAGGVFADLVDKRKLMLMTQIGTGLSALSLAILVWTETVHVWMILALSFVTGSCMALAGPSYQAMTIDLAGREDLSNAIALNSIQFQLSRAVGPTLAGLGFRFFGLAGCFFANALSFVAVVIGLMLLKIENNHAPSHSLRDRKALLQDLIDGFRYVKNRPRVFALLAICFVLNFFGASYLSLMPYFAKEIFKLGESGLATMMGIAGLGAFCGALMLAFLGDFKHKGLAVLLGVFSFAWCEIGFAFSTNFNVALMFLFCCGFAVVFAVAVTNMLLQQLVTDEMRGRVMSMFILTFIGAMPFGNLLSGIAAEHFGAPLTLAVGGGVIALFISIVAITNKRLRELH
jgi:MFS family permease